MKPETRIKVRKLIKYSIPIGLMAWYLTTIAKILMGVTLSSVASVLVLILSAVIALYLLAMLAGLIAWSTDNQNPNNKPLWEFLWGTNK